MTELTIENIKQAKASLTRSGYFGSAKNASSPSMTEKTLTSLHGFSSTGWGMPQSSRESRSEIIDGNQSSDSLLLSERRQRMQEIWVDSIRNSPDYARLLEEKLASLSFSSTTEKNISGQATSPGVTSISTISCSPVKAQLESPIVYREC